MGVTVLKGIKVSSNSNRDSFYDCVNMGYDVKRFNTEPPEDLLCAICDAVLDDPVQCENHHLFCRDCISKKISATSDKTGLVSESCPSCPSPVSWETITPAPTEVTEKLALLQIRCICHRHVFLPLDCIKRHESLFSVSIGKFRRQNDLELQSMATNERTNEQIGAITPISTIRPERQFNVLAATNPSMAHFHQELAKEGKGMKTLAACIFGFFS